MADALRSSTKFANAGSTRADSKLTSPAFRPAIRESTALLRATACDVLLCHGYKAHLLGRLAARRVGIPAVAVSRGWTGETRKVGLYEWLDRRHLRFMDHVVCVSDGQAEKVRTLVSRARIAHLR